MNFIFLVVSKKYIYFTHSLCSFIKYCFHDSKIKFIFAPPCTCKILYAVQFPNSNLDNCNLASCHEFSANLQISQQWFRVHGSVMCVFVLLTHLLSWVTGSSSGVLSITSKMALRTFLRYSATSATVGHTKLPPIL